MTLAQEVDQRARSAALGALSNIAQAPLVRAAVRYWWVTVPIGFAAWRAYQRRKAKDGDAHPVDVLLDVAPMVGLVAGLVALNENLRRSEERQPAAPVARAAQPPKPTAREADFTLTRRAAPAEASDA